MVVEVVKEIPKDIERVVLEEYYKFYCRLWDTKRIFARNIHFTRDKEKQRVKDLDIPEFLEAIKTITPKNSDINFMLLKQEGEGVIAVARFLKGKILHICDIVYLNYPTIAERKENFKNILDNLEEYATSLKLGDNFDVDSILCELPKYDELSLEAAKESNYTLLEEPIDSKRTYRTYLLTKDLRKREIDGQTLSRKKASGSN